MVDSFKSSGRLMVRDEEEKKKADSFDDLLMEFMNDGNDFGEALKLMAEVVAMKLISYKLRGGETKQPSVSSSTSSPDPFNFRVPKRKRGSREKRDEDVSNRQKITRREQEDQETKHPSFNNSGEEKKKKIKKRLKLMRKEDDPGEADDSPPLPDSFRSKIEELGGEDIKLILARPLTKTDLDPGQGRLSIPIRKVREEFLEPEEETLLEQVGDGGKGRRGVDVAAFIEPSGNVCKNMMLKKWPMKTGGLLVLIQGWNEVVGRNENVKVGSPVQVWSFRTVKNRQLGFALVVLD